MNSTQLRYIKYKNKYQRGGNDMVKLEGVTPDLYIPRDVVIVGNAPSLLDKDHRMIDNHQCVIRVNCNGLENELYKNKAGKKCDIFVLAFSYHENSHHHDKLNMEKIVSILKKPDYVNSKIICRQETGKKFLINNGIPENLIYFVDVKNKYYCNWSVKNCLNKVNIDDDINVEYEKHKDPKRINQKKFPTTGFMTIMISIASGIQPTIYGFSKNGITRLSLGHVYDKNIQYKDLNDIFKIFNKKYTSNEHDFESEYRILNKLIDNNIITFVE